MQLLSEKIGETITVDTYCSGEITGKLVKLTNKIIFLEDEHGEIHKILY